MNEERKRNDADRKARGNRRFGSAMRHGLDTEREKAERKSDPDSTGEIVLAQRSRRRKFWHRLEGSNQVERADRNVDHEQPRPVRDGKNRTAQRWTGGCAR